MGERDNDFVDTAQLTAKELDELRAANEAENEAADNLDDL